MTVYRMLWAFVFCVILGGCSQKSPDARAASGTTVAQAAAYRVDLVPPGAVRLGEAIEATITLLPQGPYKVNMEYPLKLTVTAPAPVTPREVVLTKDEAASYSPRAAVLKPRFSTTQAGEHAFSALFRFSVCTDEVCELEAKTLTWSASVTPGSKDSTQ